MIEGIRGDLWNSFLAAPAPTFLSLTGPELRSYPTMHRPWRSRHHALEASFTSDVSAVGHLGKKGCVVAHGPCVIAAGLFAIRRDAVSIATPSRIGTPIRTG